MCQALGGLLERVVADEQVGYKIDQKQLPGAEVAVLLDEHGGHQQHHGCGNLPNLGFQISVFMMVMMLVTMFATFVVLPMVVMMPVCLAVVCVLVFFFG